MKTIIEMALEADIDAEAEGLTQALERFAAIVTKAEREACAKECDVISAMAEANGYTCEGETFIDGWGDAAGSCAAAIRARGEV